MISPDTSGIIVPPIPQPRKNKRVIQGKFTITDLFVFVPFLLAAILIMFFVPMPIWGFFLVFIGFVGFGFLLCWPLGFLGKDKLYLYIIRYLNYLLTSDRNLKGKSTKKPIEKKSNSKKESK